MRQALKKSVTLSELEDDMCRHILDNTHQDGETRYCGWTVAKRGGTLCEVHLAASRKTEESAASIARKKVWESRPTRLGRGTGGFPVRRR